MKSKEKYLVFGVRLGLLFTNKREANKYAAKVKKVLGGRVSVIKL
jgi:hypothetical protein